MVSFFVPVPSFFAPSSPSVSPIPIRINKDKKVSTSRGICSVKLRIRRKINLQTLSAIGKVGFSACSFNRSGASEFRSRKSSSGRFHQKVTRRLDAPASQPLRIHSRCSPPVLAQMSGAEKSTSASSVSPFLLPRNHLPPHSSRGKGRTG